MIDPRTSDTDTNLVPNRVSSGRMLIFFNELPESAANEFRSRMIGDDWQDLRGRSDAKQFFFNSIGRLERAIELLCIGLGPAELGIVRTALVPENVPEDEVLLEAAQSMRYLGELLGSVRSEWLRTLLAKPHRFFNVFQPLVNIESGSAYAYEMLIRAHADQRGGVIGGGQLAEAALAGKLLYVFDFLAREVAIRTAATRFPDTVGVFINFMPNSVLDPQRSLEKTLNDCVTAGIRPERVVFEIVESESIADVANLKVLLDTYRAQGFKIALDDLGSGYSGLNYMLELMPDFVKLDRELVHQCAKSNFKRIVVGKLTEAAHFMGIKVIAEGIEQVEDYAVVRELGVDIVQGYLFAKPSADMVYAPTHNLLPSMHGKA